MPVWFFWHVLLTDKSESDEEEETREVMKEEHKLGGSQHWQRRRCRGCNVRCYFFAWYCLVFLPIFFHGPVFKSDLCDRPHFFLFFQSLDLLKRASSLGEEAQWLETEGLRKIESAVAGSEAEGLYGLLRGAMSHSPMSSIPPPPKKCHHTPTATISKASQEN